MPQQLMRRRVDYLVSTDFYGSFILRLCVAVDVVVVFLEQHVLTQRHYVGYFCVHCSLDRLSGTDTTLPNDHRSLCYGQSVSSTGVQAFKNLNEKPQLD